MEDQKAPFFDDREIVGASRQILVWGYVQKVKLGRLAQMAQNEETKIFFRKSKRRNLLIAYKSVKMNAYIGEEARLTDVVTGILYTVLPVGSKYKRCLVYNHGRGILAYQNLEVNGSEGDQTAKADPVQIQGTQIFFVFDYPTEVMDTIMTVIHEHERRIKDRFKRPILGSRGPQKTLESFVD